MKIQNAFIATLILIIVGLGGFIYYEKFSFTEIMARDTALKFFNILMIKESYKEFEEAYPTFGSGSRVVTPKLCKINSVTKRDDGNYDIYASYVASEIKIYPISIIVNRNGKVVNSRGVNYAYYDKTLEYGKKLGCLSGSEDDLELEKIISEKKIKSKLDQLAKFELNSIYDKIKVNGKLSYEYGYINGNVVITNNSPYNFEYGEIKCQVKFYSSNGVIVNTEDILITNLHPYSSTSGMVYAQANSSSNYKIVPEIIDNDNLKNKVKDYIINTTTYGCF